MAAEATTWGIGDYPRMARRLEPAAAALVELAAVAAEDRVLDLACGTGNAALLAAARGASVVGVDFEPGLLRVAADRAGRAGVEVDWVLADLAGFAPRERFSVVVSAFGVMYGPDQEAAAALLAATREPGGRVALAAWMPGGLLPAMGATLAAYLPAPPPSARPPSRWGDPAAVEELLASQGLEVVKAREQVVDLRFDSGPEAVAFLIDTAGNVLAERARLLGEGRWGALEADLAALVEDRDEGGAGEVVLPCRYLLTLAS